MAVSKISICSTDSLELGVSDFDASRYLGVNSLSIGVLNLSGDI